MKIRQGFVSNSSSSSFIIMAPKATELRECSHCGRSDPNLFGIIENMGKQSYVDDETTVWSIEDSLDLINEWVDEGDLEDIKLMARVEQLIKDPPKGWEVRVVEVGHHDTGSSYMIDNAKQAIFLMNDSIYDEAAIQKAEQLKSI